MTYLSLTLKLTLMYVVFLQLCKCNVFDELDAEILVEVATNNNVEIFNEKAMSTIVNSITRSSYGYPNPRVGQLLKLWDPKSSVNPEELGSYFEGDILIPISDIDVDRNAIVGANYRWPKGIVPYKIDGKYTMPQLNDIQRAMRTIEANTCVRFVRLNKHKDYISITNSNTGCWSSIGRLGGKQITNLSDMCFQRFGTLMHELLHAIGFHHEHKRSDRDKYVTIMWQNIEQKSLHNFKKEKTIAFGIPYDYGSIMHYSALGFSKNTKPTIVPKKAGVVIGQRERLSWPDILKIRAMYKCRGKTSGL